MRRAPWKQLLLAACSSKRDHLAANSQALPVCLSYFGALSSPLLSNSGSVASPANTLSPKGQKTPISEFLSDAGAFSPVHSLLFCLA